MSGQSDASDERQDGANQRRTHAERLALGLEDLMELVDVLLESTEDKIGAVLWPRSGPVDISRTSRNGALIPRCSVVKEPPPVRSKAVYAKAS